MGKYKDKHGKSQLSFDASASDVVGGISGAVGAVGQISSNIKQANALNERGEKEGEVDALGNTLAAAGAGAQLGSMFGPLGGAIGAGAGALVGGLASIFNEGPSADEMIFKEGQFQLGKNVESILPEDAFSKQQLMAKNGMEVEGAGKNIEVERDELVLRKRGRSFVKVADFKSGKTHEQGGEDYQAKTGDIIMPGKYRNKVNTLLRNRKWNSIESLRLKLPKDTGQNVFAEGTDKIKNDSKVDIPEYLFKALVNNGLTKTAAKGFIVNLAYETNDFKNLEEIGTNKHGTKGLGLAQWTDSPSSKRRSAFEAYLKANNTDVTDLEANIGFLISELKGEQGYNVGLNIDTINKSKSVKEAADLVLKKFERPQDQSEEHLERRIKRSNKFLEDSKNYTDPDPEEVKKEKEKLEKVSKEKEYWRKQNAVRHRGLPKGDKAFKKNEKFRDNISPFGKAADPKRLEANGEEVTLTDRFNFWVDQTASSAVMGLGYAGNQIVDFFTGDDYQDEFDELKFEDTPEGDALKKEYQDIIFETIDDEDMLSLAGLTDTANFISKFSTNLLTGQSTSGTDLYRGANLLSMYDEDSINSIRAKLKEKGISDEGMYLFEDMARSPQNYYSSNIKGADAIDAVTMLVNPKGAITGTMSLAKATPGAVKSVGRLTKAGIDTGITATAWTAKSAKKALQALKKVDWKSAPKKLWDGLDRMLQDAPKYAKGEEMFDILKDAEKVVEQVPNPRNLPAVIEAKKKIRNYKTIYEDVVSLAKKGRNNLSKIVFGSSFDDLKNFKEQVKATTGLDWADASKMTKKELAQATKKKMRSFESEVASWDQKMKDVHATYKNKKKELLQKVDADGIAYADNHLEVVKLNKELEVLADKMDNLNVVGENLKKKTPLAFDEDFNIIDMEISVPGSPKVTEDSKLFGETYKTIARSMDNMNDTFQQTEALKKAKTAEQLADFEKSTAKVVDESLTNITKETNKAIRPLMKGKQEALSKIDNLEDLQKQFPDIYNTLYKAKKLKDIPKNAAGFKQFMDILSNEPPEDGVDSDYRDSNEYEELDGIVIKSKIKPLKSKGIDLNLDSDIKHEKLDTTLQRDKNKNGFKNGGKGLNAVSKVGDVVSSLVDYAPALYNISKGMGTAEKANRNYVNPALEKYENNSQTQLNAIDNAFNVAIGNSRNLSGGLASNFRANVEKAHADKLNRTAQTNAQETQVATGVAGRNIQRINESKKINSQIDTQADQFDSRSEAARNSFLGQGIADVANITAVKNRDKAAQKNQDMLYDLMMKNNKRE